MSEMILKRRDTELVVIYGIFQRKWCLYLNSQSLEILEVSETIRVHRVNRVSFHFQHDQPGKDLMEWTLDLNYSIVPQIPTKASK